MVEVIESLYAIETGNLTRGSVARVVDCCPQQEVDFECIVRLGGICRDSDYPNTRATCEPNACVPFATFDKLIVFRGLDDEQLLPLIQNATLLVSIDAAGFKFQAYENGEIWGENGYIRILRGKNMCGIATKVYQPLIMSRMTTPQMHVTTPSLAIRLVYTPTLIFLIVVFSQMCRF
ncbi:unnamed protein product [Rotaria sp. Silwood1]|nr:unnamed protein product [Rotaria sp. Silwood1]